MKNKAEDLGMKCPIFELNGFCPRGVTCRFANSHLDDKGRNIKRHDYDSTKPPTTLNGGNSGKLILGKTYNSLYSDSMYFYRIIHTFTQAGLQFQSCTFRACKGREVKRNEKTTRIIFGQYC